MSQALGLYNKLAKFPGGKWLFSRLLGLKAPYFRSIGAIFRELRPGTVEISMKNRWRVRNHIGTVHAIASCNLCELAGGTLVDASLPKGMRWIPKGMEVQYLAKANSHVRAVCTIDDYAEWTEAGDKVVAVSILDENDVEVVHADITMYISPSKRA